MFAKIALGIAVVFFLLVPLGGYSKLFLLFVFGLTGAGNRFILYGIFADKGQHENKYFDWLHRVFIFGLGCLALSAGLYNLADVLAYLNNAYKTIEGVPFETLFHEPSKGDITEASKV